MDDYYRDDANWNLIPEHMRQGVRDYVMKGWAPGGFLESVLCNDLSGAAGRADSINRSRLADYVGFFYNYAPSACWGSEENYEQWLRLGGMRGLHKGKTIKA